MATQLSGATRILQFANGDGIYEFNPTTHAALLVSPDEAQASGIPIEQTPGGRNQFGAWQVTNLTPGQTNGVLSPAQQAMISPSYSLPGSTPAPASTTAPTPASAQASGYNSISAPSSDQITAALKSSALTIDTMPTYQQAQSSGGGSVSVQYGGHTYYYPTGQGFNQLAQALTPQLDLSKYPDTVQSGMGQQGYIKTMTNGVPSYSLGNTSTLAPGQTAVSPREYAQYLNNEAGRANAFALIPKNSKGMIDYMNWTGNTSFTTPATLDQLSQQYNAAQSTFAAPTAQQVATSQTQQPGYQGPPATNTATGQIVTSLGGTTTSTTPPTATILNTNAPGTTPSAGAGTQTTTPGLIPAPTSAPVLGAGGGGAATPTGTPYLFSDGYFLKGANGVLTPVSGSQAAAAGAVNQQYTGSSSKDYTSSGGNPQPAATPAASTSTGTTPGLVSPPAASTSTAQTSLLPGLGGGPAPSAAPAPTSSQFAASTAPLSSLNQAAANATGSVPTPSTSTSINSVQPSLISPANTTSGLSTQTANTTPPTTTAANSLGVAAGPAQNNPPIPTSGILGAAPGSSTPNTTGVSTAGILGNPPTATTPPDSTVLNNGSPAPTSSQLSTGANISTTPPLVSTTPPPISTNTGTTPPASSAVSPVTNPTAGVSIAGDGSAGGTPQASTTPAASTGGGGGGPPPASTTQAAPSQNQAILSQLQGSSLNGSPAATLAAGGALNNGYNQSAYQAAVAYQQNAIQNYKDLLGQIATRNAGLATEGIASQFASGLQLANQTRDAALLDAAQQAVSNAGTMVTNATSQQNANTTAFGTAGDIGNTQQQLQQSGLQASGQLSQPIQVSPGNTVMSPQTGNTIGTPGFQSLTNLGQAEQNISQGQQYQQQASTLSTTLNQMQGVGQYMQTYLQQSGLNPTDSAQVNALLGTTQAFQNFQKTQTYNAMLADMRTYVQQVLGASGAVTPTDAGALAQSFDPANMSYKQLTSFLTDINSLGNIRLGALQSSAQSSYSSNGVNPSGQIANTGAAAPNSNALSIAPDTTALGTATGAGISTLGSFGGVVGNILNDIVGVITKI